MDKSKVDYSLYLVTDSTRAILGAADFETVVREAVEGGVTTVQLRDKTADTASLVRIARGLHKITKQHGIPLLINDRLDVALAVGCEGVHLGQDDMDLKTARRLLGPDAIIGISTNTVDEARQATLDGADYLGIGTLFSTQTKENIKSIIGTAGLRNILTALSALPRQIPTVCIGGIKPTNLQRVIYQSTTPAKRVDGIAIVSAIMGSPNPRLAASTLLQLVHTPPPFAPPHAPSTLPTSLTTLLPSIPALVARLAARKPLCHNMTNTVVQNLAANVALAVGGSPIMSGNGAESADLAALGGSLVINMGTASPDALAHYMAAIAAYNAAGNPVLLDPVGGGATAVRRAAVRQLMAAGYFSIIKGNEAEIQTVLREAVGPGAPAAASSTATPTQHGVDSGPDSGLTPAAKARLVRGLAARERCVIVMTGATDYISDGARVYAVSNGHAYLGAVTGTGCSLGTTIAAFAAVERGDVLLAVLAGMLMYEIAAERAAGREGVRGPGGFVPAFLDELCAIREESRAGGSGWIEGARVEDLSGAAGEM